MAKNGNDERMSHDAAPHDGGYRDGDDLGEPRSSLHDKAYDLVDYERRRKLREKFDDRILPPLPEDNQFHRCWVSTTHPIDTPQRRKRFGYRFVQMDTVRDQGWSADIDAIKDGQFAGAVMWRELIAMELPQQTYEDFMMIYHFDMPQEQAAGIVDGLEAMDERVRAKGGRIDIEEATMEMRRKIKTPPTKMFE